MTRSDKTGPTMVLILLSSVLWNICTAQHTAAADKRLQFRPLGQPTADKAETGRKINELALFEGRLYLGHGDWFKNTGPTDVIYYDFAAQKFVKEFTVEEEAIVRYRRYGDRLFLPGADTTQSWEFGNLYVREASAWKKHRTVPRGLHVFDFAEYEGRWVVATGSYFHDIKKGPWIGAIYSSEDEATSWQFEYTSASAKGTVSRFTSLAPYRGRLYAFGTQDGPMPRELNSEKPPSEMTKRSNRVGKSVVYDGGGWFTADIFSDTDLVQTIEPMVFADHLLLNVRVGRYGDQFKNEWRLLAYDGKRTRRVALECDRIVDMVVKDDRLILLLERQGKHVLVETTDLAHWRTYLLGAEIKQPLSVECDGDSYYLGLTDGTVMAASGSAD